MKKTITTTLILAASITAYAQQQKQLPATVKIELTDKQVLRIDSAIQAQAQKTDSKSQTIAFINAFEPLYKQITDQLIIPVVPPVPPVQPAKKEDKKPSGTSN